MPPTPTDPSARFDVQTLSGEIKNDFGEHAAKVTFWQDATVPPWPLTRTAAA